MPENFFSDSEIEGLREISLAELREICDKIVLAIKGFNVDENGKYTLKRIGDLYHTVTGTAGIVGLMEISGLASEAEDLAKTEDVETGDAISKLRSMTDHFNLMLSGLEDNRRDPSRR